MVGYFFTILGRTPSKKNSRRAIYVGGRTIMVPSKDYESWHKDASKQLKCQKRPKEPIEKAEIVITFYAQNKVGADLTNKAESVMDLLVDNRILVDDNWFIVGDVHLKFGGVDRTNPRAEVEIKK